MNASWGLKVWSVAALVGFGTAPGSVRAVPTLVFEAGTSVRAYAYDVSAREDLVARRSAFDPSDGLQGWERRLLAMDPNGAANLGR